MELNGKKINFLGDSITEGAGASAPERSYVELLGRQQNLAAARNYGIGGTRLARQRKPSEKPRYDLDFCSRFRDMDPDADLILVFGGTNDHGHGDAPMGCDSDRTPESFIGACHTLYAGLKEAYPKSRIVVVTPLHRQVETRADGITLKDYVNQIRRIANIYGLPVLDLYASSAIRAETLVRYTTDGLHPNDEGHKILALEIGEFLKIL